MTLTPEQKQAVSAWIAAGDNLSVVQQKLIGQYQITLTYRDVRFLVDDLNLELKDPAPKVDTTDLSKTSRQPGEAKSAHPSSPGPSPSGVGKPPPGGGMESEGAAEDSFEDPAGEALEDLPEGVPPDQSGASSVSVQVDKVTLLPGALASGSVTFSDGVSGKWVVDQQGRPGLTEISQPNYRPTPADGQAFMRELSAQLQRRGF